MIYQCRHIDPNQRPQFEEILKELLDIEQQLELWAGHANTRYAATLHSSTNLPSVSSVAPKGSYHPEQDIENQINSNESFKPC